MSYFQKIIKYLVIALVKNPIACISYNCSFFGVCV